MDDGSEKRLTKEELSKLNSLFGLRKTGAGQQRQQFNDYWHLLAEKYHFHSDHTLIHNETGEWSINVCMTSQINEEHKSKQSNSLEN